MSLKGHTPSVRSGPPLAEATNLASRPVDLVDPNDQKYVDTVTRLGKVGGSQNWRWYEAIGEVRYGVSRSARIAGYGIATGVRINPAGATISKADQGVLAEEVAKIYSPFGSVRHLLERYYTLLKVPGTMWLARMRQGTAEDGYLVLSDDELDRETINGAGPIIWRTIAHNPDGTKTEFERKINREDFLGRIWAPSARWIDYVDSPMTGLATECEVLHLLTETMKGRIMSRFAMAGILLIPSEMSDAAIAGPNPNKTLHTDKVLNYFVTAMTRNMATHDTAQVAMPIAMKGPSAVLDKVKHLVLETAIDERDLKLRTELIGRILTGLDVQKNAAEGVGDTNHWAAWAVSDEERRIAVQPDIDAFAWALTRLVLWPALRKRNWAEGAVQRVRLVFDLSEASVKTNLAEDFRLLQERGGVSLAALRRVSGAKESDAPDNAELVRLFGMKHADPYLAFYGLDGIAVDYDKVGVLKRPPGPTPGNDDAERGPGVGEPGSPDDRDTDQPRSERPA